MSGDGTVRRVGLGLVLLLSVGCASPRQAVGVGLVVVGAVAGAAGIAASDIVETSDPSVPDSKMRCLDGCVASSSPIDALLAAGGAAAVVAGEALIASDPAVRRPQASATAQSPAATPLAAPSATPAPGAAPAPLSPASAAQTSAPAASPLKCLGPLQDPIAAGCATR